MFQRKRKRASGTGFQSGRMDILLAFDVPSSSFSASATDILLRKAVPSRYLVGAPYPDD